MNKNLYLKKNEESFRNENDTSIFDNLRASSKIILNKIVKLLKSTNSKKKYDKIIILLSLLLCLYSFKHNDSGENNKALIDKFQNHILIGLTSSSLLNLNCKNKISDIIPIIVIESAESFIMTKKNKNIIYLSIEKQNRIFPDFSTLLQRDRRENIGYLFVKKFFAKSIIFKFNGDRCLNEDILALLKNISKKDIPKPNYIFTKNETQNLILFPGDIFDYFIENNNDYNSYTKLFSPIIIPENTSYYSSVLQIFDSNLNGNKNLIVNLEKKIFGNISGRFIYFSGDKLFIPPYSIVFSYVPCSLEKELSNMYRNIIMEYFLKKSGQITGFIKIRAHQNLLINKNYYEKAKKLINYLTKRKIKHKNLIKDYTALFEELFNYGFIGKEDLKLISIWGNYSSNFSSMVNINDKFGIKQRKKYNSILFINSIDKTLLPFEISLNLNHFQELFPYIIDSLDNCSKPEKYSLNVPCVTKSIDFPEIYKKKLFSSKNAIIVSFDRNIPFWNFEYSNFFMKAGINLYDK